MVRVHIDHGRTRSSVGWMVHRARFVAMGLLHQLADWADRRAHHSLEGPREPRRRPEPSIRSGRRHFDCLRVWWRGLCVDRIEADSGFGWRDRADGAVLVGIAYCLSDGSAWAVPFQGFQRSQPAHLSSLRGVKRHLILFSARFDSGARLLAHGSWGGPAAFDHSDVPVVTLVGR